jgi:hypothetical protein
MVSPCTNWYSHQAAEQGDVNSGQQGAVMMLYAKDEPDEQLNEGWEIKSERSAARPPETVKRRHDLRCAAGNIS